MRRLASLLLVAVAASALAAPVRLRTNTLAGSIGIDSPKPLFSWQSDSVTPNWRQSAYEIVVATKAELLSPRKANKWDSSKVSSAESVNIRYDGPTLRDQQEYFWSVRVWDGAGKSSVSNSTTFETSLLSASDWKAQWITRKDAGSEAQKV